MIQKLQIIAAKIALLVFSVALILGAAELCLRFSFTKKLSDLKITNSEQYFYYEPVGTRQFDFVGGRHHIKNKKGFERSWDGQTRVAVSINSWGFRGGEIPQTKKPHSTRILFLGDSIAFGGGLEEKDTFVKKIDVLLNQHKPESFEIINGGVEDNGLTEEIELMKTDGIKLHPDLVVLCWYLNDGRPPVGFPNEVVFNNPLIDWLNRGRLFNKSYLVGWFYQSLRNFLLKKQVEVMESTTRRFEWWGELNEGQWKDNPEDFIKLVYLARNEWGSAWNKQTMNSMLAQIEVLKKMLQKENCRLSIVAFPVKPQIEVKFQSDFTNAPQIVLGEFCQANHIPFLDPLPKLKTQDANKLLYDQCHYSPEGSTVVAKLIYKFLTEKVITKVP